MSFCCGAMAGRLAKLAILALVLPDNLLNTVRADDGTTNAHRPREKPFLESRQLDMPSGLASPEQLPPPGPPSVKEDAEAPSDSMRADITTSIHRVEAKAFRGTDGQRPQLVVGCRNGDSVLWVDWKVPAASVDPRVSVLIERDAAMASVWRLSGDRRRTYAPVPAVLLARLETARTITVELMWRSGEGRVAAFDVSGLTSRLSPVAGNCG